MDAKDEHRTFDHGVLDVTIISVNLLTDDSAPVLELGVGDVAGATGEKLHAGVGAREQGWQLVVGRMVLATRCISPHLLAQPLDLIADMLLHVLPLTLQMIIQTQRGGLS